MRTNISSTAITVVAVVWWLSAGFAAAPAHAAFEGPFVLDDGINLYVVNEQGTPFTVELTTHVPHRTRYPQPVLAQVFDPSEQIVGRHEFPGHGIAQDEAPAERAVLRVPGRGPGVYKITVYDGSAARLEVNFSRPMSYGVLGTPQWLRGRSGQFTESYVYLPPGLKTWPIEARGTFKTLRIEDEQGEPRLELSGRDPSGEIELPSSGGHVWRMTLESEGDYRLGFNHLPIILCPDPQTAHSISASVHELPDGEIAFHRFQVRAQQILQRYREMPPEAFEVSLPDLSEYTDQWLANPQRNRFLLGQYGIFSNLRPLLHEQNLDPASPWFGMIHVWKDDAGEPRSSFLADYNRQGLRGMENYANTFAALYALDEPFNPFHHDPALLNRFVINVLQNLMTIKEHELLQAHPTTYEGGIRAFSYADITKALPLVAEAVPDDVREVWIDGLRLLANRHVNGQIALTVNQWLHLLTGTMNFYLGTGETWYRDRVHRQIDWLTHERPQGFNGQRSAGYHAESGGPDATYNGMTGHQLAVLYNKLEDETYRRKVKDSLARMYRLFNHTTVPEPGGETWLGASDFAHRTPGSWMTPQYGAGLMIMADELPSAALRRGRAWIFPDAVHATDPETVRSVSDWVRGRLRYYPEDHFDRSSIGRTRLGLFYFHYHYYPDRVLTSELPMLTEQRFARQFGDEFFAVRRPAYYALIYAGSPMGRWQRGRVPEQPDRQYPRNGGGLSIFWSPEFGSSLIGKNWGTYAAHTLSIVRDDQTDWADYWTVENTFDADRGRLTVIGEIRDQPMRFKRNYQFHDDHVLVEVELATSTNARFDGVYENFPYPLEKSKSFSVTAIDSHAEPVQRGAAQAVVFDDGGQQVHVLVFDKPRPCEIGPHVSQDYRGQERKHGRVLTALPVQWREGQPRSFRYVLMVAEKDALRKTLRRANELLAVN